MLLYMFSSSIKLKMEPSWDSSLPLLPVTSHAATAGKSLQLCPTLQAHRRQPTRLLHPWDSPGKNTGVGCRFLLQCMKVKSESEVAQLCPTPSDLMDCSLQGSSVHEIFQSRVLECVVVAFSVTSHGRAQKCLLNE